MRTTAALNAMQVRGLLELAAHDAGSQSKLAELIGVSPAHLSMVMAGKKPPTGKILAYFNLARVVSYEPVKRKKT